MSATGIDLLGKGLSQAKRLMIEIDVNGAIVMVPTEVGACDDAGIGLGA